MLLLLLLPVPPFTVPVLEPGVDVELEPGIGQDAEQSRQASPIQPTHALRRDCLTEQPHDGLPTPWGL